LDYKLSALLELVIAQSVALRSCRPTLSEFRDNELYLRMVNMMKLCYGAAPLLASDLLHTEVRRVGQHLLDALAEEESRYQEELGDEDIHQWEESRNAVERRAVDYISMVKLYLQAIRTVFPRSSN